MSRNTQPNCRAFRSFGMWVKILCLPDTTFATGSEGNSWEELEASRCSGALSSKIILPWTPVAIQAHFAIHHPAIPRRHFDSGFRFLFMPRVSSCWRIPSRAFTSACCWNCRDSHNFLRWRCWRSRWRRGTRWQTRYDESSMIWRVAMNFIAFLDEMWFLATRPMVTVPRFFAELCKWENGRWISKTHYCHEQVRFTDVHRCLFFCWHFAVACHNRRRILPSSLSRTGISPTVGEEGEDEEDEEEWLSCLIGVRKVDQDAEEELDKPGTTIGTKFSVLQIIRIPSLMRCGFWPLIHS